MNVPFRHIGSLLCLALLLSQGGCIALNIPSERLHDPDDRGGLFGHWRNAQAHPTIHSTSPHAEPTTGQEITGVGGIVPHGSERFHDGGGSCLDCDLGTYDPLDSPSAPPAAEIPWPKFHPVPTRPVFGPASGHLLP
jgi:hypothetical protein